MTPRPRSSWRLADREFDEHGRIVKNSKRGGSFGDDNTIILERDSNVVSVDQSLFDADHHKIIGKKMPRRPTRVISKKKTKRGGKRRIS